MEHKEQIFSGDFEPTDAVKALRMLMKCKTDFKKSKHISKYEQDHSLGFESLNSEISSIEQRLSDLVAELRTAISEGKKVQINSVLSLKISE